MHTDKKKVTKFYCDPSKLTTADYIVLDRFKQGYEIEDDGIIIFSYVDIKMGSYLTKPIHERMHLIIQNKDYDLLNDIERAIKIFEEEDANTFYRLGKEDLVDAFKKVTEEEGIEPTEELFEKVFKHMKRSFFVSDLDVILKTMIEDKIEDFKNKE